MNGGIILEGTMVEIVKKLRLYMRGREGCTLEQFVKGEQLSRLLKAQLKEIAREVQDGNGK